MQNLGATSPFLYGFPGGSICVHQDWTCVRGRQFCQGLDKGKHGKFDFLWKGPYIIYAFKGKNAYFLKELDGTEAKEGPVNGRMLKHYFDPTY